MYSKAMYASEKYVKMESKEIREMVKDLANDLSGDIRYLHQELIELKEIVTAQRDEIMLLREKIDEFS